MRDWWHMSVTNKKRIYYGPHLCPNGCGTMVCRAAAEEGGVMFVYPDGPIYPNTQWVEHGCMSVEEGATRGSHSRDAGSR